MSNYYPDDDPTQHIPSYGNYGAPPEPEPVPWYRKPAALVGLGAGGALIAVLIVYAIVQLFSSESDNKPARLTPISATSAAKTTTTTQQTTAVAPPATETVTETQAPDTTTTTETTTTTTTTEPPVTTTTTTGPSVTVSTSTTVITNTVIVPQLPQRPGN